MRFTPHPLARMLGWSMTVVGVLSAMFLAVAPVPAVVWTDERGRRRWSPLWMPATDRQSGPIQRHNRAGLERLARALHVKLDREVQRGTGPRRPQ